MAEDHPGILSLSAAVSSEYINIYGKYDFKLDVREENLGSCVSLTIL